MEVNYVIWIGIILLGMLIGIILFVLIEQQNDKIVVSNENKKPNEPYQGDFWYKGDYYYSQDYFYQVNGYHYTNKMYHENYPIWGEAQKPLTTKMDNAADFYFKNKTILSKKTTNV